jgi:hypothetical protein
VLIVPKEGCMTPTLLEKRGLVKSIWVDTMTPRLLFIKMGLKLQAKQSKAKQSKAKPTTTTKTETRAQTFNY